MPDKEKDRLQKLIDTLNKAFPKMTAESYGRIIGYGEAINELTANRKDQEKKEENATVNA